MKTNLQTYLRGVVFTFLIIASSFVAKASHINGVDLAYSLVSGNTYKVTLTVYGNCSSTGTFPSLATAAPVICIYDSSSYITSISLALTGPGVIVHNVCPRDTDSTSCTSTTYTLSGTEKFVYTGTYTLPSTSKYWRFIYDGGMGTSVAAGRVTTANLSGGITVIYIQDTLNNLTTTNNSASPTVIPSVYYCLNYPDAYNPYYVDPDGDSLVYSLVGAMNNGGGNCTTPAAAVGYNAGYSGPNPLGPGASSFSFVNTNGQVNFTPITAGTYCVVYNIREYRAGVVVGTCQRETYFTMASCTIAPPHGVISGASIGTIVDTVHYAICQGAGAFSFHINPTEIDTNNTITVTAGGIPAWATFTITNNGTNHPTTTFSGNATTAPPGNYTFTLTYVDNACPIPGTNTVTYNVAINAPISTITFPTDSVCVGSNVTYSDVTAGGTWSSASTAIATVVPTTGVITGVAAGTTTISYTNSAGCYRDTVINVSPLPAAITGTFNVCVGSTTTLSDVSAPGTWISSTPAIATVSGTGVVTGVAAGTDTIKYKLFTGGCFVTSLVTVNALPAAITGAITSVCVGSNITYADVTAGGTWSSRNAAIATVSGTGVITGVASGTDTILYTMGTGCFQTKPVTVNPLPSIITGSTSLCVGTNITLADSIAGGTWTSSTPATATITGTGIVTGVAAGTTTITYTLPTGCLRTLLITVVAVPAPITGTLTVCTGLSTSLSDATPGGTWSSSNAAVATVGATTGVVTGVAPGNATITCVVGSGCFVTAIVTVNPSPAAITGTLTVCIGSNTVLADATAGGTWTSSTTTVATVAAGTVTGVAVGTSIISYTVGSCSSTATVTVNTAPAAIGGTLTVCNGATTNLTDAVAGGTWTSATPGVATVSATGVVTGVSVGTAVISYAIGTCVTTATVTVNTQPAAITGTLTVCLGSNTVLSDATPGGVWSSVSPAVATVAAGTVTGVSLGTSIISYTLGTCAATATVTVNNAPAAIGGTLTVCNGFTTNLTDAVAGGTWTSATPGVATVSATGVVTGVSVGTAVISYSIGTCSATATVTVNTQPAAITGSHTLCNLTTTLLSDITAGGTWSSVTPGVATISAGGLVTAVSVGTTVISYTLGSCAATFTETVTALPAAAAITGAGVVCVGSNIGLSDATAGGVWSSQTPGIATITAGGIVTGVANGLDSIFYSVTNSCGTAIVSTVVTVNPLPNAGTILGPNVVCAGSLITLTDAAAGGVWSASNGNATVATGVVTGVTAGVDVISYTVSNSCGNASATYPVTVQVFPTAGSIAGPAIICVGSFAIMTDVASGGTWSSSNGSATVSATGVVSGISAGVDTISYSVTNPCGTAVATKVVSITPLPTGAPITGPTSVCVGSMISLTDAIAGGTWHATNGHGTVSATGVVSGVSAGTDTIYYSLTNSCGTTNDSATITINPLPNPGTITGSGIVCVSSNITLVDPAVGGTFSASNGNATVVAGTGVVTGVNPGVDTITYTIVNVCGTATTDKVVTIDALPSTGSILGPGTVCVGAVITLTNTVPGGTWSTSNPDVTISASGVVTGVTAGTDTVSYTLSTACGSFVNSVLVIVNPLPSPGTISGPSTVCVGSLITLTSTIAGGNWTASNGTATIGAATGVVVGVSAGIDTMAYAVTNSCGTSVATALVTVNPFPTAGVISGPSSVCVAGSITLTETIPGGTWSSSSGLTTITAGGVVTGVTGGTDTISYTVSNSCGTVGTYKLIDILPAPNPGTITGAGSVCLGSTLVLTDATPGGVWSSTNNSIATVAGGVVTAVGAGTDTILYSLTNVCGTFSASAVVSVVIFPSAGAISGPSSVCVGSAITLLESVPGGVWLTSNGNATMLAPGILTGVTVGSDSVFYSVTNACGTAMVSTIIAINPVPVVAAISGPTDICIGAIATLTDATAGGSWTSSTPSVATIDLVSGLMTGVSAGTATITYTVTNIFGCPGTMTQVETVHTAPVIPSIAGITHECVGGTTTLNNTTTGGTWSSSNTSIATVGAATGVVAGVAAGVATITYSVVNICGTSNVTIADTVIALPVVSAIAGTMSGCIGATATLTDATAGGVWSSGTTAVATIDAATGVVTGVAAGTTNINYTVTNAYGCTSSVNGIFTVNPIPVVSAISGITNECVGGGQTLTDATAGGTWSSSNASIATVDASGNVSGISAGISTISYAVTNGFGCIGVATVMDTVNAIPTATPITGITNVCVGGTTALSNSIPFGTWSSSNTTLATVNATGVVTGVAAGNVVILYSINNSCGSVLDSVIVTVISSPSVLPITGPSTTVCSGATTMVTDGTPGGVWSSSNATIATVSASGVVTGLAAGVDTILYTITGSTGCPGVATYVINFGSSIGSSFITPASSTICHGNPAYLHVITSGSGLSYQWMRNGNVIPGATGYNYYADSPGSYSVVISNGSCEEILTGAVVSLPPVPVIGFTAPNILYTGSFTSYQWYRNGIAITGATSSVYVESAAGNYVVVVTDVNGCSDTSAVYVISGSGGGTGTGFANINNNKDIRLYPNPVTSTIHIDAAEVVNVRIFSPDGKMVIEQQNATEVNVSSLSDGMYIIMVYSQDDVLLKTDKFMKMN